MDHPARQHDQKAEHRVRPRAVWGGVVLAIVGMAAVAVGLMGGSSAIAVVGATVGAAGLTVAWRGGILYDAHGRTDVAAEVQAVEEGSTYRGVSPDEAVQARAPRREAEETARRRRRTELRPEESATSSAVRIAPALLLGLAAWTYSSQYLLAFPLQETAVDSRIRVTGVAIVLALAALALRQIGPSRTALVLCALCGLALVASSFLAPHAVSRSRWSELLTGALVLLLTALAARARRGRTAAGRTGGGGSP